METKKSKKSDLEKVKSIFFQFGLIISLAIVITAFEWNSISSDNLCIDPPLNIYENIELPPITFPKEDIKPPAPKATLEIINIVKDDEIIIDTIQFKSSEFNVYNPIDSSIFNNKLEADVEEPTEFWKVEIKPTFKGGEKNMYKFLIDNTDYPKLPRENGIQGTVYVEFTIDKTGKIFNARLKNNVDPYLDRESLRVVNSMPDWTPGLQAGKAVSVRNIIPIKFILSN